MSVFTSNLGFSVRWNADDRRAVTKANAKHWKRWKAENGGSGRCPVEDIPGFVSSVQELYDYGYSHTDIGAFFGVSRERVRQWFSVIPGLASEAGSSRKGSLLREWDWDAECFLPVTIEEVKARHRGLKAEAKSVRHELRRAAHVRELKRLAEQLGRTPRTGEFYEFINSAPSMVAYYWGRDGRDGMAPYSPYLDALWAAAGMGRAQLGDWNRK